MRAWYTRLLQHDIIGPWLETLRTLWWSSALLRLRISAIAATIGSRILNHWLLGPDTLLATMVSLFSLAALFLGAILGLSYLLLPRRDLLPARKQQRKR